MDEVETRRKRLLYQSAHRGTKESDLLLGAFAEAHLGAFTSAQLDRYEALLEENDRDIFDWVSKRSTPPAKAQSDVLTLLLNFRYPGAVSVSAISDSHHSPPAASTRSPLDTRGPRRLSASVGWCARWGNPAKALLHVCRDDIAAWRGRSKRCGCSIPTSRC